MKRQFVIIGCGRFGSSIAKTLYSMDHDVMILDRSEERILEIADFVTHSAQVDATDEKALRALGIRNFDTAVISIGSDIQASIMATLIAKELGISNVVCKAQTELQAKVLYKIGADKVVFPERDMGVRVAHNLVSKNVLEYIELDPNYSIVEIIVPKKWSNKSIKDLDLRAKYGINVMAVKSLQGINISPSANVVLQEGENLVVIGKNDVIKKIEEEDKK
ncbi:MAG: TrkA family potassium uptake protein [Peptostreptococcaceae bacterium]|jgi:trk system potassium uptake protein TrkA|nr:TrkA family potassium uptake protein [Peptostreptococcaceae bacterium]